MQHQHAPPGMSSFGSGFNFLYMLASFQATCFLPFTRHSFGAESLGINGLGALAVMTVYLAMHPRSEFLSLFWCLWWIALIYQRIRTFWLYRRGMALHSHFVGHPWLGYMVPFVKKFTTAEFCEVLICMGLGFVFRELDKSFGDFVILGAISLAIKSTIETSVERARLRRMRDAEMEQRDLLERYRRGDF